MQRFRPLCAKVPQPVEIAGAESHEHILREVFDFARGRRAPGPQRVGNCGLDDRLRRADELIPFGLRIQTSLK
jgi:hypothetical protein